MNDDLKLTAEQVAALYTATEEMRVQAEKAHVRNEEKDAAQRKQFAAAIRSLEGVRPDIDDRVRAAVADIGRQVASMIVTQIEESKTATLQELSEAKGEAQSIAKGVRRGGRYFLGTCVLLGAAAGGAIFWSTNKVLEARKRVQTLGKQAEMAQALTDAGAVVSCDASSGCWIAVDPDLKPTETRGLDGKKLRYFVLQPKASR